MREIKITHEYAPHCPVCKGPVKPMEGTEMKESRAWIDYQNTRSAGLLSKDTPVVPDSEQYEKRDVRWAECGCCGWLSERRDVVK